MHAMMRRRHTLAVLAATLLVGCSATRLKNSWTDPGIRSIHFRKIVAFVVAKDEALRRTGEDQLCKKVTTTPCVPAFSVVPDDEITDAAKVKRRIDDGGFDGAVVLRLAGRRVQQTYVPPTTPMWGYYGGAWPMAYDPGYVRQDDLVDVETRIYSVTDAKLLWAGTTESTNPRDVRRTIDEIADAVAKQLRKEGLIPPKP